MKKKVVGIQEFFIRNMLIIAVISVGLLLIFWGIKELSVFSSESRLLRVDFQESQRAMLKREVNSVVDYINYRKQLTEEELKAELQGRVDEAFAIATNIYEENKAFRSTVEIEKMIKDALRPIRFLDGRGYYFAFSMEGIETLFPDRPEMEGVNMIPVQGARGEFVVKDMIDIVKKNKEGFYSYTWTKPAVEGRDFLKIAFVKYFEPLNWVIGTGEYLDDFTDGIQKSVLDRIVGLRFNDEGYFFGSISGGYPLFTDGKITRGSNRIWDMMDLNGVKIIQEQQKVSMQPGGGFVEYVWHKLGSSEPLAKISFVRQIPDWGWTIGAGLYMDTVEKVIAQKKDSLKRDLITKIITSLCVLVGLILLIWVWAKQVAGKTGKSINAFEDSFKKATTESVTIPSGDMQFLELSRIADSANRMIDAQKRSEIALRDSEERFRGLFNHMSVGAAIYSSPDSGQSFIIRDFNIASEKNTKKQKEEVLGREVREVFPGVVKLGLFEVMQRVWLTGNSEHLQSGRYEDDKLNFWAENHISKLPSGELVVIFEDITAKKRAEKEREQLEKQLLQSLKMQSIGNLAGGIAHDFNNILSSIIGFTEMALEDIPEGSPLEDNLQEVYTAGLRARDLVKQILAFARQSKEDRKPMQVDSIAKEVVKFIRSTIPTTIEVRQNIVSRSLIMGSPTQIHQIFMNLCTNAAQAMEDTGGILDVGLEDVVIDSDSPLDQFHLKHGGYVKITVSDTGCGIPEVILGSIFEPYFTTKDIGEGTGMGLALVHGIVESYGGKITVESESGKGTVFSIYLPVTESGETSEEYEASPLPSGTERILLVDDELAITKIGARVLQQLGYSVTTRTSSVEALDLFRANPDAFDLVITDTTMPDMTGDVLAMELIKIRADIPVILCTGYSKRISEETVKKSGIKAFAYKPIVRTELSRTVRKVLDEAGKPSSPA